MSPLGPQTSLVSSSTGISLETFLLGVDKSDPGVLLGEPTSPDAARPKFLVRPIE